VFGDAPIAATTNSLAGRWFAVCPATQLASYNVLPRLQPSQRVFLSGPVNPPSPRLLAASCVVLCRAVAPPPTTSGHLTAFTFPEEGSSLFVPNSSSCHHSSVFFVHNTSRKELAPEHIPNYTPSPTNSTSDCSELSTSSPFVIQSTPSTIPQCQSSPSTSSSVSDFSPSTSFGTDSQCVSPAGCQDWQVFIDEILREVRAEIRAESSFKEFNSDSSRKRKLPLAEAPVESSSSSTISCASESADEYEANDYPKRGKKYSLTGLSAEEIAERKKEQNRIAAQRYRSRKNQTLEEGRGEISHLEKRNEQLRKEEAQIAKQIRQLKAQLVGGISS
jgi:hypothetical protein